MAFPTGMWCEAYYFITYVIAVKQKHFLNKKTDILLIWQT